MTLRRSNHESFGAQKENRIVRQGLRQLIRAIKKFPRKMWKWRGQNDPWTIHEIIVHVTDSEANSFIRCRRFIAEPGKDVLGYDEMLWARELNYLEQKPEEAIQLLSGCAATRLS